MSYNNVNEMSNLSLFKQYYQAIKKVPFLKYSLILPITCIILAFIAYLKLDNTKVFFYALVVLFITFLTSICAKISQSKDKKIQFSLYILIYCIVVTTSIAILSFGCFILFEKPAFYERWFPQQSHLVVDTFNRANIPIDTASIQKAKSGLDSSYKYDDNKQSHNNVRTEKTIEVSIQLSEKSKGFSKIFINGQEIFALATSTKLNPRIQIKNNKTPQKLFIITLSGDSCFSTLPSLIDKSFFRIVPSCN
jgi:hypothetical protein